METRIDVDGHRIGGLHGGRFRPFMKTVLNGLSQARGKPPGEADKQDRQSEEKNVGAPQDSAIAANKRQEPSHGSSAQELIGQEMLREGQDGTGIAKDSLVFFLIYQISEFLVILDW